MEVNGGQDKKSEDENKVLDGIKSVDKAENTQQEEEQKGDKEGETISTENSEKIKNEQVETQAQAGQGKGKEREDAQNVLGLKQESEQVQVQEQESEQVQEQEQRVIDKAKSAEPVSSKYPKIERKQSFSKVQVAIHDILTQFDPLKEGTKSINFEETKIKAEFYVEKDGFNYNKFLEQLRRPAAKPIAKEIKAFLLEFIRRQLTLNQKSKAIHEFITYVGGKINTNEVWRDLSDREKDNAREGVEKLIMNKLYSSVFSPQASDDSAKDKVIREKITLFQWLKEEHLDIKPTTQSGSFLQYAKEELSKMNSFKSPRDKMICIMNCCTVIFGLLRHSEGGEVGADSFLPLLIYIVIKANPAKLVSNVQYISRFRSPDRLTSEAGYYLTNVMGAISFIESMDASCLSITQAEFERNLEMAIWEIETEKKARIRASSTGQRSAAAAVANNAANRQKLGYFGTFLDEEATERGAWLLEKGSSLAKSTIAKTNQFVERVINELSSLDTPSNSSSPIQSSQLHTASTPSPNTNTNTNPNANLNPNSNSTAPEFSETLALVCDMFPTFDKEVCEMVLQANDGFVPQTIEQLLEMGSTDPLPPANEAEFMQPEVLEGGQAADDGTGSMHEDEGDDWRGQWADDDSSDNESDNDESPDNDHDSSSQHHVQGGKESKS